MVPYADILAFVQQIAPTWCKTQHVTFAQLIGALLERENLALSDLGRALPQPTQSLHGRLKRINRFLDDPRLDEIAVFARWLKLTYRFGADLPALPGQRPLVPLLLDTVYVDPVAMLVDRTGPPRRDRGRSRLCPGELLPLPHHPPVRFRYSFISGFGHPS